MDVVWLPTDECVSIPFQLRLSEAAGAELFLCAITSALPDPAVRSHASRRGSGWSEHAGEHWESV